MVGDSDAVPTDALDDIAYLARSANRVSLLDALTSESYTRRDLDEHTGIARTTIGRILNEFEERGWVERTTEGKYTATPRGEHVTAEFGPLVEAMQAIRNLDDTIVWLPTDELSIGLQHFQDATVRPTQRNSPNALATYLLDLMRDASTFYTLTYLAPTLELLHCMRERVVSGQLTAENVFTADLIEYLHTQSEQRQGWQDCIEAGAGVYSFEGRIPCNVFIVDGTVLIANNQPDPGHPCEFIESPNETVRRWARELVETYRNDAERVSAEGFS